MACRLDLLHRCARAFKDRRPGGVRPSAFKQRVEVEQQRGAFVVPIERRDGLRWEPWRDFCVIADRGPTQLKGLVEFGDAEARSVDAGGDQTCFEALQRIWLTMGEEDAAAHRLARLDPADQSICVGVP